MQERIKLKSIINIAKQHYHTINRLKTQAFPHSKLWDSVTKENSDFIYSCNSVKQAIAFAQKSNYYDHRKIKHRPSFIYQYFENILYNIHPSFRNHIPLFAETPISHDAVVLNNPLYRCNRLVSTTLYIHTSYILSCLEYDPTLTKICEIGGGYGDIARLWLTNPIKPANFYMIIDLPQSLFFAEVFLRTCLPDIQLIYLTSEQEAQRASELSNMPTIILCPIQYHKLAKKFNFEIIINTLSFGEMTQEWVEFWSNWINSQSARLFYSSNVFGSELDRMFESECLFAPIISSDWVMTKYSLNHPYQAFFAEYTRPYAEIWFEKIQVDKSRENILERAFEYRKHSKFAIGDLIFFIYNLNVKPGINIEIKIIKKFLEDMPYIPKELLYWVKRIKRSNSLKNAKSSERDFIYKLFSKLQDIYSSQKSNFLFRTEKKIIKD